MKSPNYLSANGHPRRNRVDLATPVEQEIRKARETVEMLGADVRLTDASTKLAEALDLVADWLEETGNVKPEEAYVNG